MRLDTLRLDLFLSLDANHGSNWFHTIFWCSNFACYPCTFCQATEYIYIKAPRSKWCIMRFYDKLLHAQISRLDSNNLIMSVTYLILRLKSSRFACDKVQLINCYWDLQRIKSCSSTQITCVYMTWSIKLCSNVWIYNWIFNSNHVKIFM